MLPSAVTKQGVIRKVLFPTPDVRLTVTSNRLCSVPRARPKTISSKYTTALDSSPSSVKRLTVTPYLHGTSFILRMYVFEAVSPLLSLTLTSTEYSPWLPIKGVPSMLILSVLPTGQQPMTRQVKLVRSVDKPVTSQLYGGVPPVTCIVAP